jgi:hypothetical protein
MKTQKYLQSENDSLLLTESRPFVSFLSDGRKIDIVVSFLSIFLLVDMVLMVSDMGDLDDDLSVFSITSYNKDTVQIFYLVIFVTYREIMQRNNLDVL